eukprot:CAMPEP_0203911080 /NCGR_PEP_ID=MMETSP0359-20131031/52283_1 /ASSEMBLY_ACC=CAM_ASM_000338 /TAXON_ID=268821 /ORGANISM="Scrippsiella Hangoei, Strain SHTV-5" /LENGTH=179 /DNA_ID=CAMNT_0050836711 /DNA_START=30 /DNA_END=572 /DNA_ORIENTATION=-
MAAERGPLLRVPLGVQWVACYLKTIAPLLPGALPDPAKAAPAEEPVQHAKLPQVHTCRTSASAAKKPATAILKVPGARFQLGPESQQQEPSIQSTTPALLCSTAANVVVPKRAPTSAENRSAHQDQHGSSRRAPPDNSSPATAREAAMPSNRSAIRPTNPKAPGEGDTMCKKRSIVQRA